MALAMAVFVVASSAEAGGGKRPIVVELFTSQGCNSCPPADALLGRLTDRKDVLAVSLPITYWDMMGWKDTLASENNTRRQKSYSEIMGHGGVYTPQMIVDGASDVIGSREAAIEIGNRATRRRHGCRARAAACHAPGNSRHRRTRGQS